MLFRSRFDQAEIDEIVEARYEEIFEAVAKELKKAGRLGKLPSGVVLTGGGANVKNLAEFAKEQLSVAAQVALPIGYTGVSEDVKKPEFAAVVGLIMIDSFNSAYGGQKVHEIAHKTDGFLKKLFSRFK